MKVALQGVDGLDALFSVDGKGVLVNTRSLRASVVPLETEAMSRFWVAPESTDPVTTWEEVARCALSTVSGDVAVTAAVNTGPRLYTVPRSVVSVSKAALDEARFKPTRYTQVSKLAANMLASGGQVTLDAVQHLARFFAANEDDRGSLRWNLWGGDAAARWARGTVNRAGLIASGDVEVNLLAFYDGDETTRTFFAQKGDDDPRNDEVVALFKRTPEAGWQAWFSGDWYDCPAPNAPEHRLIELDDDAAVFVAGALFDAPDSSIPLRTHSPEEWDMAAAAYNGVDWHSVDETLVAAPPPQRKPPGDGVYSPEERSQNATKQLRDANGRFAQVGDTGTIKGSNIKGRIAKVDGPGGYIYVTGEDGNVYQVPPAQFVGENYYGANPPPIPQPSNGQEQPADKTPPLNLDRILAQPRATSRTPKAMLKHLLPPMGPAQLRNVITDYEGQIKKERLSQAHKFRGGTGWDETKDPTKREARDTREIRQDVKRYEDEHAPKKRKRTHDEAATQGEDSPPVEKLTPETTDVKPLYLAIVDRDDPQAVTDLIAMIPATSDDTQTTAFRRVGGTWVEDAKVMQDMRSPTPPPVVQLDEQMYQDVLHQVDTAPPEDPNAPVTPPTPSPETPLTQQQPAPVVASFEPEIIPVWGPNQQMLALIAAAEGGVDRNKGGAEKLRRYWLYGPGALKIMWNTPGDWTRCYRLLSKYMGVRAKGYCALRHKEATGHWTGDKENLQAYGYAGTAIFDSTRDIKPMSAIIASAVDDARVRALKARVYGGYEGAPHDEPEAIDPQGGGRRFRIPLLIPEGLESGDGRTFDVGSIGIRNLPLPLFWQPATGDGHDHSYLVGRMDRIERVPGGLGNVTGVFDTGPWAAEAQRLVENNMLRWVSVDLDRFKAKQEMKPAPGEAEFGDDPNDDGVIESPKINVMKGRVMGATLVGKPAFQEVTIELEPLADMVNVEDGMYTSDNVQPIAASAAISTKIPVEPPDAWFGRPVLNGPTPITVTDEGQVFGHIATWETTHIGLPQPTRAPRSASNYAYFHTGVLRCNSGKDVRVGQLTLAGGHADILADAASAVRHYDDTGSAIADVTAGEDRYGIWVAGALRPGTSAEQVRSFRASAPSGDWRNINGRLELVAVCQVNVPGFPVVRSQLTAGAMVSLVAAGAQTLAQMKADPEAELANRVAALERFEQARERNRAASAIERVRSLHPKPDLDALAASARARVYNVLDVDGYLTEFKAFSPEKRNDLASKGHAMKDGSFPIENVADLRRAVKAYGRTSEDKQAAVRRHIVKRARALEKPDVIPSSWSEAAITDDALRARDAREVLTAAALERRAADIRKRIQ